MEVGNGQYRNIVDLRPLQGQEDCLTYFSSWTRTLQINSNVLSL